MRFALVTGTSSGIGAAVARGLVERGWEVLGVARREAKIPGRYTHLELDLSAMKSAARLERRLGKVLARGWQRVGLVNNAAVGLPGRIQNAAPSALGGSFTLNVAMPLWLMGFVAKSAPKGAAVRMVNVSSGAATRAVPGLAAYCSAKAALRMAGMTVAEELEGDSGVLSYSPGVVDTEMQLETRSKSREEFPSVEIFQRFHAEGLLAPPEAPAKEIIEFLESEAAERFAEKRRT